MGVSQLPRSAASERQDWSSIVCLWLKLSVFVKVEMSPGKVKSQKKFNRNLFLTGLEVGKIKVLVDSVSSKGLIPRSKPFFAVFSCGKSNKGSLSSLFFFFFKSNIFL